MNSSDFRLQNKTIISHHYEKCPQQCLRNSNEIIIISSKAIWEYISVVHQNKWGEHYQDKLWLMLPTLCISGQMTSHIKYHPNGLGMLLSRKKVAFSSCISTANTNITQHECCSGIFPFILRYFLSQKIRKPISCCRDFKQANALHY